MGLPPPPALPASLLPTSTLSLNPALLLVLLVFILLTILASDVQQSVENVMALFLQIV